MSTKIYVQKKITRPTGQKEYNERGGKVNEVLTATAEIHSISGQDPYFAVTGDTNTGPGGMLHEMIAKHVPEFAPYLRWHLTSINTGPMHYIANGVYWWKKAVNREPKALDYFKSTIVYGSAPTFDGLADGDLLNMGMGESSVVVKAFLVNRFGEMMNAFHADMRALFGDDYQLKSRK